MTPVIERRGRTWQQRGVIALNVALILSSLGAAFLLNYGYGRAASINRVALGRSLTAVPEGQEPGERVMNILLVGSDSSANLDEDDPIQIGRQGERFGDVIIVAHIDERSGNMALLSLPRDLWVEIGDTGRESRINRAFVDGGPATLIETIENEFDIPIHHYVNVDFAGFQGLVSAIGSVDVYFEQPARDWNVNAKPEPRSQTGFLMPVAGCHSLDPETALAYVRSRYYQTQNGDGDWVTDPTSDLGRIRRQQDFLRRVLKRAIDVGARNPFVLRDLIDTGLENVAIDQRLTPQLLLDLGMAFRSFDPSQLQTYSFPAVDGQVGRNQVLLPLEDEAEPVLELFRGAPFDDPYTVGLTVIADPEAEVREA
ncbi:MAG: LCP family protein, partial [Actinomycetota bacterium]